MSIDGVGAFDLIPRQSMLDGLSAIENGEKLLPFVRSFYGAPSTYFWEDEMGTTHEVRQGEGGEQGDPLMPLLFSLGQHRALVAVQARLREGERLFAFLDDVYVICAPDRAGDVHKILQEELWRHAKIQVHHGKTKMWNRSGTTPAGVEELTASARVLDPNAVVWRGNHALPTSAQGFKVLGVPINHPDFVEEFLARKTREHELLFERIPAMEDLQSAWLVLLFCAAPRANFWLRSVRPELVQQFAASHDANTWGCLARLIGVQEPSSHSQVMASLQFSFGGLGLTSATRGCRAAHWASWIDSLAMTEKRHPEVARITVANLPHDTVPSLAIVNLIGEELRVRMDLPTWEEFAEGTQPQVGEEGQEPTLPRHGWQKRAHECLEDKFVSDEVWPSLSDADRAMVRSQRGPFAAAPFVALPTCRHSTFVPQVFRVLLRRRLRLPLPLSSRSCRCGRLLDPLGHHRAGCSEAGVLGKRGYPLEKAAEQVCREAGARVSSNVYVRDMDLAEHNVLDNRRLEVVADGLSLWNGSQLAIDTTLVSPLHRDGRARRKAATRNGAALQCARRRKTITYPELSGEGGRARLVVLAAEVGGRFSEEAATFAHALAKARSRSQPPILRGRVRAAFSRRWEGILACTAAKSFAVSLLDRRPACNTGMDPSLVNEVVRDSRFS